MRFAILAAVLFTASGILFVPRAGLQDDEIVFASPLYRTWEPAYSVRIAGRQVPLMILSYAGTLKTALYWPVLHFARPTKLSARMPMVLVGALTVLIFYAWAKTIAGTPAALVGSFLLATDPIFLLTDTFDWGPVAIEHLLVVSACWVITRGRLLLAGFLFGLALWNKASFVWTLTGLAAGATVAYWPQVRAVILKQRRTLVLGGCSLLAGALPLLVYNVTRSNATLGSKAHLSLQNAPLKFIELERALDGSGLFGYLVREDWAPRPKAATSSAGQFAIWVRKHAGKHQTSLFPYILLACLLAVPLWWRSRGHRAAILALVCSAATFLAMLVTRDAGVAIHHTVLLWPMPQLFAGVAIGSVRRRWLLIPCVAAAAIFNLLVVNQYYSQFVTDGAGIGFSDAADTLSSTLTDFSQNRIYGVDWGIENGVEFLTRGRLQIHAQDFSLISPDPSETDRNRISEALGDPRSVFVDRVSGQEFFSGAGEHLLQIAQTEGYSKETLRTVPDSNGRTIFEVFRFRR
ncbi:MAG: glycosyltransferase family 39 protein [Acidobacteriia bacterium]|nr:glycosyltransferase family 39 protein [Terriglobia bacterium]